MKAFKHTLTSLIFTVIATSLHAVGFDHDEFYNDRDNEGEEAPYANTPDYHYYLGRDEGDEDLENPIFEEIGLEIKRAIYESFMGFDSSAWKQTRYPRDENLYRPMLFNTFETSALLADVAREPLFLENKEEFSVEMRPFFTHQNWSTSMKNYGIRGGQIGGIMTLRKQKHSHFLAGHVLYSNSSLRVQNEFENDGNTVILATTGGILRKRVGASLQLSAGGNFSKMNRDKMKSHPKMVFFNASPLVVFYTEPFPLDFFIGGDLFYANRFAFDETGNEDFDHEISYDSSKNVLWKFKAGPSYTFRRRTEISLAVNVQSAIPDHLSYSPKVLFESQGNNKRGGWLLGLGFDLSKHQKDYTIAGGIRF